WKISSQWVRWQASIRLVAGFIRPDAWDALEWARPRLRERIACVPSRAIFPDDRERWTIRFICVVLKRLRPQPLQGKSLTRVISNGCLACVARRSGILKR